MRVVSEAFRTPAPVLGGMSPSRTEAEIEAWIVRRMADVTGIETRRLDAAIPLANFGLGSIELTSLACDLAGWLHEPVARSVFLEHPSIEALSRHLARP